MKGTVKFYNVMKRFGFITGEDGRDYFVHVTGLKPGVRLFEGDHVTFDVEETERGPKAVNVAKEEEAGA
ncbi:cold shock domain-containing protein [Candidatus Micrarchaeota archaeon]|nr:cold shock domain-containing protein [Candidatus Micrarchaeota archaeon]